MGKHNKDKKPTMKKRATVTRENDERGQLWVSEAALAAFLEALFSPAGDSPDPLLAKLAQSVARRSAQLSQDGEGCRKFYKKLYQDSEYAHAVAFGEYDVLEERIARGR